MAKMREFAEIKFEQYFPNLGNELENALFKQIQLHVTGGKGMDFYGFRRLYKRFLQSLLTNFAKDSNLVDKVREDTSFFIKLICSTDSREWNNELWSINEVTEEDDTEIREGQFACSNCARKGQYSRNTTHRELQTRSADEPMTVIMECHTCSKTYRFSS